MNQKIIFGIMCIASVASIFVACGKGAVEAYSTDDNVADLTFAATLDVDKSLLACQENLECQAMLNDLQPISSSEISFSSANDPISSSSTVIVSSSSTAIQASSSSSLIVIASSSSAITLSSSSLIVITSSSAISGNGLAGTCAPSPAIAELGQTVAWTFSKDASVPVTQILTTAFDWTFEGGSIDTASGSGATGISKSLTYATSGQHTATLKTTLSSGESSLITCTPLQVNGARITGCKCDVDNASPDVASTGEATWTVSGCITTATITGYTWNGGELGSAETTSHTFTKKDEAFTPTLSVSNDDNTVQVVTCPAAKAIDANIPDYEITASGGTGGVSFEKNVDATIVMNLSSTWHGGTTGTCIFACQVNRDDGSGAVSGTVDGVAISGSDYVTARIPITSTISGYPLKLELDIGTNASVNCFVNW